MATVMESYDTILELCEMLDKRHPCSDVQSCEICELIAKAEVILAEGGWAMPERKNRCTIR